MRIVKGLMWLKQCHKPPVWEWLIPPIYGEIGGWFMIVLTTLVIIMMITMGYLWLISKT